MTAVHDGRPVLEDGRRVSVTNVVWCTGYDSDLRWVDVPVDEHEPDHRVGVVPDRPGLYFVGLHFQYSLSSTMIHGVGRDARRVVAHRPPSRDHARGGADNNRSPGFPGCAGGPGVAAGPGTD